MSGALISHSCWALAAKRPDSLTNAFDHEGMALGSLSFLHARQLTYPGAESTADLSHLIEVPIARRPAAASTTTAGVPWVAAAKPATRVPKGRTEFFALLYLFHGRSEFSGAALAGWAHELLAIAGVPGSRRPDPRWGPAAGRSGPCPTAGDSSVQLRRRWPSGCTPPRGHAARGQPREVAAWAMVQELRSAVSVCSGRARR
jgi:hypothetical protein